MAWSQTGANLKGPKGLDGATGPAGRGVQSAAVNASGELVITLTDSSTLNLGVVKGAAGADGKSVSIQGSVAAQANLPTGLGAADAGKGYITANDGHLWVWSGTAFTDVGTVRGPQGPEGPRGLDGAAGARGTRWFTGSGAPNEAALLAQGAAVGDLYLDTATGNVYTLS